MTNSPEPSACSCSLDPSALTERLEAWRRVVARATSRSVEDDRIVGVYPNDPRLLEELRALVDAEAQCCSFLELTIHERPGAVVSELRLPAELPEPMRAMVLDVVGRPHR